MLFKILISNWKQQCECENWGFLSIPKQPVTPLCTQSVSLKIIDLFGFLYFEMQTKTTIIIYVLSDIFIYNESEKEGFISLIKK